MGHFSRVEDRPTPKAVYNWRVYSAAMIAAFAAVMIGSVIDEMYDAAFIGTSIALPSFKAEFALDNISPAKFALISANIVSLYQAGSDTGLGIVYAGRVIVGLAIGAASNLAPIYVAEISPPAIRGRLIGLYELCWQIGGVVVQFIPGGLLFIGAWFLTESPRWLVSRNRNTQALTNLAYLRHLPADHPYVVAEYASITQAIAHERRLVGAGFLGPPRTVLTTAPLLKRLLIGSSLFAWQNATGINAINYYSCVRVRLPPSRHCHPPAPPPTPSPTIFTSLGITGTNTALLTTGVYGISEPPFLRPPRPD
ncbi:hypothetical protein C0993_011881 [Termitomyces sp. T159_Od127]|nr:hypothetical protein C0993_011881 [Termitomyces sp. T159_Od127]